MNNDFRRELDKAMQLKASELKNKGNHIPASDPYLRQMNDFRYSAVELPYKRFDKALPALFREDYRNAGFDCFARINEPITLQPGELYRFPLNVAVEIPFFAVGLVFHRSSTFSRFNVHLTNNVGVVDSLFCGDNDEVKAEFINNTDKPVTINPGDKLCQMLFLPLLPVIPVEVDHLGNDDRGGYGTSFDNVKDMKKGSFIDKTI